MAELNNFPQNVPPPQSVSPAQSATHCTLSVSLVIHTLDADELTQTLQSLQQAIDQARRAAVLGAVSVYLVDNSEHSTLQAPLTEHGQALLPQVDLHVLSGHGNLGFGRAHNLALTALSAETAVSAKTALSAETTLSAKTALSEEAAVSPDPHALHLILNPDVFLQPDALAHGIRWLQTDPATIAVAPAIVDGNGQPTSSCKRYPSVLDFLLRGFAPQAIKRRFRRRLAHYEMAELPVDRPSRDIPIISGCFMLFRRAPLLQLQGFDAGYFLYFEDFDLALRAHRFGSLTYLPQMRITHLGGNSARKGWWHIRVFMRSAVRFFNTHGWRWT